MIRRFMVAVILGVAVCATVGAAMPQPSHDFLRLDTTSPRAATPDGWIVRAVRGQQAPMSTVVDSSGERFFRIRGAAQAAWFVHELATPLAPMAGRMEWSWRMPESPRRADLRRAATDDAALRVFVVFEREGFFDRTPHTLFYTSGVVEAPDYARPSFQSSDLHVIRMSAGNTNVSAIGTNGASNTPAWTTTTVDPFADYVRIWGGAPRRIVAVGFMQDTEQTRSSAVADVRRFHWTPGAATP